MNQNTKMLLGAVIAAVLAIAVYYGAISQQTASNIQTQANQTLGTNPATQQPGTASTTATNTAATTAPAGAPAAPAPVPASQNATAPAQPK